MFPIRQKYSFPTIKSVKLEKEQAIIQVCQVGGGYVFGQTGGSFCQSLGGMMGCRTSVKGQQNLAGLPISAEILSASS